MKELVDLLVDFKDKIFKDGRSAEYSQLAREKGFKFRKRERFADQDYRIKDFILFKNKSGRRLKGLVFRSETNGTSSRIYDFWSNNDMEESKTTVIELYHPELNISPFEIRPKRMIKWAKEIIAREQKPFGELVSFNSFYEIKSPNILNTSAELNEVFLDLVSTRKKLRVEGTGQYLLVYYKNKQIPVSKMMEEYQFAQELLVLLLNNEPGEDYV